VFLPEDVTELIVSQVTRDNAMESNSSTLLLSLATSLAKVHSNASRPDIGSHVILLMNHLTDSLLPPVAFPEMETFRPELLQDPRSAAFRMVTTSNPELLFEYFGFLAQTISRYSTAWTKENVQRWMLCILVSLGMPEGGMSFQGSIDFLVVPCTI
jgi:hypothetical protein